MDNLKNNPTEELNEKLWNIFDEGRKAFHQGIPRTVNPYNYENHMFTAHWDAGWNDARREDTGSAF